ncbi:hypothetical protein EON63_18700, partial [archaeon]
MTCSACYSYNYTAWATWLLQPDVLTALNVCGDAGKDAFAGMYAYGYGVWYVYSMFMCTVCMCMWCIQVTLALTPFSLHSAGSAGGCISMGAFDARDNFDYSGALGRALNAHIPVSLYYGKTDTACDYKGGSNMANTLVFNNQAAFRGAGLQGWELGGGEV